MPELPEVQTTGDSLKPLLNQTIEQVQVFQPKLRWQIPQDITQLVGYALTAIERRAKYLILTFNKGNVEKKLLIHLGMSGSLQQHDIGFDKRKHDHLIIDFSNGKQLHYHDPRRFGMVLWLADYYDKLIKNLGIEPLDNGFTGQYLYDLIQHTPQKSLEKKVLGKKTKPISRPIKAVIMEQSVVVGVGNIYATESLFLAGIHPLTPADTLTLNQLTTLVKFIKQVLEISIEKGGSSLKDFTVGNGKTGYFQQTLRVYGRGGEPCPQCGTMIENVKIAQRASTFCPQCQPLVNDNNQK
ncbi:MULTISPECIES: bifunctional DNA-formamidopyrimidine glycosylase/DNA-(apurinic or apyrimidinic site) lyase [unclassified Moraxella]|uniref:bifunctional DNA-formamidopyrimidine glycosylase/DNA-(apurinic or apyrimidinic site) lyase n=1 Tax=unclassified Moraxella TaxID=2685852 RepID=UPI003AF6A707